jgi:dTDP-4-amino-4,6-dideoxygalactose transaminase
MQNFGFAGYDNVIYIGTNGKMSEISAAMGLASLESLDEFRAVNKRNYLEYQRCLERVPGLKLLPYDGAEENNYQYIVVEVDESRAGLRRDELMQLLHAENVLARRYFYPGCHRMEPYRSYYPQARLVLPATERVLARLLLLPTGVSVQCSDIESVCTILGLAIGSPDRVRRPLARAAA